METTQLTTVGATVAVDNARATISETFDSFLKLLTTQLRYQDPTSPMNSTEFTSQLVQFSQVEQQLEANDKLDSLIGLQGASQIAFAASLAGKYIEIAGDTTAYAGEGTLDYGYRMPAGAVDTTINIVDRVRPHRLHHRRRDRRGQTPVHLDRPDHRRHHGRRRRLPHPGDRHRHRRRAAAGRAHDREPGHRCRSGGRPYPS